MKKIIKTFVYTITVFLIIYNIMIFIQKILIPDHTPDFLGYKNFVVVSGSMEPILNIGDIVFVKENEKIKENDIIAFKENDSYVTHRVIEIIKENGETLYKTKGDANTTADQKLVAEEKIEGVYCFKIVKIGNFIIFLQSKTGIVIFLIILFVIYLLINVDGNKTKNKSKGKHAKE